MLTLLLQATLGLAGCPSDLFSFFQDAHVAGAELCSLGEIHNGVFHKEKNSVPGQRQHTPQSQCPACLSLCCHSSATLAQPDQARLSKPERDQFSIDDGRPLLARGVRIANSRDPPLSFQI